EEKVKGPGERRRRRLVAGEQQRHQLVAQVGVVHPLAVLEASLHQLREDVVTLLEAAFRAAFGDLGVEQLVDGLQLSFEFRPGPAATEAAGRQTDQLSERRAARPYS